MAREGDFWRLPLSSIAFVSPWGSPAVQCLRCLCMHRSHPFLPPPVGDVEVRTLGGLAAIFSFKLLSSPQHPRDQMESAGSFDNDPLTTCCNSDLFPSVKCLQTLGVVCFQPGTSTRCMPSIPFCCVPFLFFHIKGVWILIFVSNCHVCIFLDCPWEYLRTTFIVWMLISWGWPHLGADADQKEQTTMCLSARCIPAA